MLTFETPILKYKGCEDSYFLKGVMIYCCCNLKIRTVSYCAGLNLPYA